jgi:hypothetical protein
MQDFSADGGVYDNELKRKDEKKPPESAVFSG